MTNRRLLILSDLTNVSHISVGSCYRSVFYASSITVAVLIISWYPLSLNKFYLTCHLNRCTSCSTHDSHTDGMGERQSSVTFWGTVIQLSGLFNLRQNRLRSQTKPHWKNLFFCYCTLDDRLRWCFYYFSL